MNLEVGTIIYVIDPKGRSILPARVNEQVVSRKIEGETVTHNVQMPNGKVVSLESLDTSFFNTVDDVRSHLLKKAEELIDESVSSAKKIADDQFGSDNNDVNKEDTHYLEPELNNDTGPMEMTLPDGSVAKVNVKVPTELFK
jgi:hypothetical protein